VDFMLDGACAPLTHPTDLDSLQKLRTPTCILHECPRKWTKPNLANQAICSHLQTDAARKDRQNLQLLLLV